MQKRILTLITTSFLSFKSFDVFSRDIDLVDNTEHFGTELKRQMAEESILQFYNSIDFGCGSYRKAIIS